MHVTLIAGARPNFMKVAPIIAEIEKQQKLGEPIKYSLVHTGQHFDEKMSTSFFKQLNIPEPNINLACGGGTQAEQTAAIMVNFEKYLLQNPTDLVLVVGDVNSTMACAIVAQKCNIKVAHVEGGIRSNDWSMVEEINRLVTDSITNYFFTTSELANQNLLKSGVSSDNIFWVGNTMIDTLLKNENRFIKPAFYDELGLQTKKYLVLTLHRPTNVDQPEKLNELIKEIIANTQNALIIFAVHPRTRKILDQLDIHHPRLFLYEPLPYLEFNYLIKSAMAVITDSGGITEETTVLGIPCITLRDSTERPETCTIGTNELIGTNPSAIKPTLEKLFLGNWKKGGIPPLWDGNAAERIVKLLLSLSQSKLENN